MKDFSQDHKNLINILYSGKSLDWKKNIAQLRTVAYTRDLIVVSACICLVLFTR